MSILPVRPLRHVLLVTVFGSTLMSGRLAAQPTAPFDLTLRNPSFEEDMAGKVPAGWTLYAGRGTPQTLSLIAPDFADGRALLLEDGDPAEEIGVLQNTEARGGLTYEARVDVAAVGEPSQTLNVYLQMRFLPSNTYVQRRLFTQSRDAFETLALKGIMPENDDTIRLYLYTHRGPTTTILLDNVGLRGGVEPPPEPVSAPPLQTPHIETLKDLHLTTTLVQDGQAESAIVTPRTEHYTREARKLQDAIRRKTGVRIPIATDSDPEAALPLTQHRIVLGNRSTNALMNGLYDAYFTLLDLKYPGREGYLLRSLHNPYGNGANAILVGASDDAGITRAAERLLEKLEEQPDGNTLALPWMMDIQLGSETNVPDAVENMETWEASDGYGSVGYFGWNSLSKHMAMYYMTGNRHHADEFLRLAFPDNKAREDISRIDGERIENKDDPLAGAYHYNQHMMTLYWDLIEESPVFTDRQRLRITNALARQLEHEDYAREGVYKLTAPATAVGTRHGQWAAIGLLCLGRYFNTHYPDPVWEHCERAAQFAFASLHDHAWLRGESDNLFWYNTGIAPIFTYLCLTGDRTPVSNGVIAELLRGQEILLNGSERDRQLNTASLGFLHKAAYITGDGRWIHYRERTRMNTDSFRLGQSFWPDETLEPTPPTDLVGKWTVHKLPRPMWLRRGSGIPFDQSFQFGSFRTETGPGGDFVLLDGFNGASRNPYHTFAVLDLRIAGTTLLQGYHNQVLTKADGMVEPQVAMDAALTMTTRLGGAAVARGQVPDAAFCNWQRTLLLQLGRYALVVDDLTFRTDSRNMAVNTVWQTQSGRWLPDRAHAIIEGAAKTTVPPGWLTVNALDADCTASPEGPRMIGYLEGLGIVLLRARDPGVTLTVPFTLEQPFQGQAFLDTIRYADRGVVRILIDGVEIRNRVNLHAAQAVKERIPLGEMTLNAGKHTLQLHVVDRLDGAATCYAAVAGLALKPANLQDLDDPHDGAYTLSTCDPVTASGKGIVTMQWTGPVSKDQRGIFFHLLAPATASQPGSPSRRLTDNAAVLALPETALAVVGSYAETTAELAVLSRDTLTGIGVRAAGLDKVIFRADRPVNVHWNLAEGTMVFEAPEPAVVTLPGVGHSTLRIDGRPVAANVLEVNGGRYVVTGAALGNDARDELENTLARLSLEADRTWRTAAQRRRAEARLGDLGTLETTPIAAFERGVTDLVALPTADKSPSIAVAENMTVHILQPDGRPLGKLETDGAVRTILWWEEADALLAGCADEKLIAFDRHGNRKWTFTSVMDPAVFRAAKTYWFKSAPGHEGIHGIATGRFSDDKPQCIVGSACTAEIVNADGTLAHRLPVFWGPGKIIRIVDAPDGSRDALIARWPNGTDRISIINNRTLNPRHSFYGVPAGHTMVGGWSAQNRVDLIWEDINADGQPELVSATNGRWNRVTVFERSGKPLYNAQFGPGQGNSFRAYLRDLKTADPDGDGQATIYTATHDNLVVALDNRCRRLWSTRLQSAPSRLQPCGTHDSYLLVGCDDGTLLLLDADGRILATSALNGRISHLLKLADQTVIAATHEGGVHAIAIP